jgi:hypothetical protein
MVARLVLHVLGVELRAVRGLEVRNLLAGVGVESLRQLEPVARDDRPQLGVRLLVIAPDASSDAPGDSMLAAASTAVASATRSAIDRCVMARSPGM